MSDVTRRRFTCDCGYQWLEGESGSHSCIGEYRQRIAELEQQLSALQSERQFPMQHGPSIPWSLAERIYAVYVELYSGSQSLERLAQRGGFGWAEVQHLNDEYRGHRKRKNLDSNWMPKPPTEDE